MKKLKLKKILSLVLAMSIMLTTLNGISFPVTAAEVDVPAGAIVDAGTCGDTLTWTLYDDGTLIVSGTGMMYDYSWNGSLPWGTNITEVIIEEGVTTIGSCAFYDCAYLTSIIIPNSVTSIGERAFSYCHSLKNIIIPNSVTSIGVFAFNYCTSLTNVSLSNNLNSIENGLFTSCQSLVSITIPSSVTSIGEYVFQHCTELISIALPEVSSIGNGFLYNCSKLNHVFYGGAEDEWKRIVEQEDNTFLASITTHTESTGPTNIDGCEIYRTICTVCNELLFATHIENGEHSFRDGICSDCGIIEDYNITYYITDDNGSWGCNNGKILKITGFYGNMVLLQVPEFIEGVPVKRICNSAFWNCWNLEHVFFWGDAPIIEDSAFEGETLTCYYPKNNNTWTEEVLRDYGGNITWIEHSGEIPTVIIRQPWSEQRLYGATIELSTGTNKNDVSYQWQYRTPMGNWIDATDSGSTTETVKILFKEGMDGYQYRCAITDEVGKIIYSDVAELLLLEATELQLGVTIPRPDDSAYGSPRYFYFTPEITDAYALIGSGVDYFYDLYDIDMQYIEWNEDDTYVLEAGNTYIFLTDSAVQASGVMTLVAVHNYICEEEFLSSCAEVGAATYVCTYCNDSYTQIPHTYDNGVCINCGEKFFVSGTCGENLNWKLTDDGTLTISGTGDMTDYAFDIAPWYKYVRDITNVTIKDGVTYIGDYAFCYCSNLTDIVIPTSVRSIGCGVFEYCNNLNGIWVNEGSDHYSSDNNGCLFNAERTKLVQVPAAYNGSYTIPDSVVGIEAAAFCNCVGLTGVDIPNTMISIGENAFMHCSNLLKLNLPDGLKSIGRGAFACCFALEEVSIPSGIKVIEENTFQFCESLASISIPNSVTTLGGNAFEWCLALTDITIPKSVTYIGDRAFAFCWSLESVTVFNSACVIPDDISAMGGAGHTVIYGYRESTAQVYADNFGYAFEIIPYCLDGLEHSFNEHSVLNPSCTEEGISKYICAMCGDTYRQTVPPLGHSWAKEWTIDINSTCTTDGSKSHHCTRCDSKSDITAVAPAGHKYESIATTPTCTKQGYTTHICSVCNDSYIDSYVSKIDHTYNEWTERISATCVTKGEEYRTCSACGYEEIRAIDILGHKWESEWTIDKKATCTTDGSKSHHCTRCDSKNDVTIITSPGHSYTDIITPPTCTEKGYTTHICSECNDCYKDNYVDTIDHAYGEWFIEIAPDCINVGTKYQICSVCKHKNTEPIAALGHSYSSEMVVPTCTKQGYTVHTCSVCKHSYKDTYVNANGHSYGDWVVDVAATVLDEGSQHRGCTVCEHTETQTIERVEIDIDTNTNYGLAVFTVVNAQTLEPINSAQIFISTEKDGENTFTTDSNGQVSVILPIGKQVVSVYASGCLTRNLNVNIKAGINEIKQIGLSDMPTYDAEITSTLMTIEEIEEAGIDTSDPSNQHVYKYELKLEFEPEIDISSIVAYFNADGTFLGGYSPDNAPVDEGEPSEPTYNLHYHVTTDGFYHSWCKNVEVDKGQNVSLTYYPWRDSDDYVFDGWYEDETFTKKIYSVNIEEYTTYVYGRWIYIGEEEKEPVTATSGIRVPVKDEIVTVYPVNEYFYLIIRGEVKWLKEMFDVEMLVINNSKTDTLEDLTATLELPEGLSLAKMVDEQQSLAQEIDYIGEGESKSVHWYVRGDTAGSYSLKARLEGMVMPFEEPIDDVFVAENQLQVWAGDALHLHFEFPNAAYYGEDYPITITLTNVSDITLYNINHMVQIEQGMIVYYSDGTKKEKIERSSWKSIGVREFHPGDKIMIETSVNIFFESEIIQMELEKLIGIVDGIEQLVNAFKAIQTAIDATDALINCVSGCSKALDDFNFSSGGDQEKLELFKQLHSRITGLASSYTTSGNKTIDAAVGLANSGVNASLNAITSDPDEWLKNHSVSDIKNLLSKIGALENSIVSSADTSKKFDIYDSIRTAISAIPIRFALKNVIMTEDENNTTSIPWSYSVTDASVQYFGVSNVSKYLMSLTQAALGEVYDEAMPWYLQLIPGLDDPFNQDAAIQYIQATENEIAQFKAKDATGKVTFKAWVERNEASTYSLKRNATTSDFILSCDNETATYENGVLTFTGDGMISVTPQSQTGGTLYIEDSEGNIYTYVIDVVEEHTCSAGEQQVVIAPTADYDGFAVKCCSTCGDIMEIIPLYYENCCEEHNFSDWMTTVEATCADAGVQIRTCTSCGTVEYQFLEMIDHTCETWEVVKEATCSAEGKEKAFCSVCESEVTRTIEKTSHTEGDWIVSKEATAFEEGVKELYCSVCETVIKTESIPMTDESFGYSEESEEKLIVGLPECVTPDMLIAHYDNMGLKVTVTDAEGEAVEYVGTGCKVYFGDVEYTVVLKGDTTGDGIIDIFDMLSMLDYINGEGTLEGAYKEAGLVVNEEEIDIFDALTLLDHVNGDASINS